MVQVSTKPGSRAGVAGAFSLPSARYIASIVKRILLKALSPQDMWIHRRLKFPRTPAWRSAPCEECTTKTLTVAETSDGTGVNVYAFLSGEFGLGESARQYVRALMGHGVSVALHDLDIPIPHNRNDREFEGQYTDQAPFGVSLLFVNPDCLDAALARIGEQELRNKYLIACCFWELGRIPCSWLPSLTKLDELLVASRFNEEAFKEVLSIPVLRVPIPISRVKPARLHRKDFGLPDNTFVFLCTFDFNSWMDRKNPMATIEAFLTAFKGRRDDVLLLVKTSNGFRYAACLRQLLKSAAVDSRVVVRDDIIGRSELAALQHCCDAYVSLHRSEGFGLGMAESMLLGKPVIATGWSGNLEFMDYDNSFLVRYKLVPVEPGQYLDADGQVWAEPDIGHAAELMLYLVSDRQFAADMGVRAASDVARRLSPDSVATIMANRLREIHCRSESQQVPGVVP